MSSFRPIAYTAFSVWLTALALPAAAANAADTATIDASALYNAQTIVTGTGPAERRRGMRVALAEMLAKLTGRPDRVNALSGALDKVDPAGYVATFEYEDRMKDLPLHDEQGTRDRPHYLRVAFAPDKVTSLLQRLGMKAWPQPRRQVAVWLAVDTGAMRYVLSDTGANGYGQRAVLKEQAMRRGLPLFLPASDTKITPADIAADNKALLAAASPKGDAVLDGTLTLGRKGYWNIAWHWHGGQATSVWRIEDVSFDRALKTGLDRATTALAQAQSHN